jgi:hypothetical protein
MATVIPAKLARLYNVTPETIFAVRADHRLKTITLQTISVGQNDHCRARKKKAALAEEVSSLAAFPL